MQQQTSMNDSVDNPLTNSQEERKDAKRGRKKTLD